MNRKIFEKGSKKNYKGKYKIIINLDKRPNFLSKAKKTHIFYFDNEPTPEQINDSIRLYKEEILSDPKILGTKTDRSK